MVHLRKKCKKTGGKGRELQQHSEIEVQINNELFAKAEDAQSTAADSSNDVSLDAERIAGNPSTSERTSKSSLDWAFPTDIVDTPPWRSGGSYASGSRCEHHSVASYSKADARSCDGEEAERLNLIFGQISNQFNPWKTNSCRNVSSGSARPQEAMTCILGTYETTHLK